MGQLSFLQNPTWILLVLAAFILLFQVKPAHRGEWHENFLSLPVSKCLLGLCAFMIVMHHCAQTLAENAGALSALENAGVCFVGLFFLFSGYGLFRSLKTKENYLKGFFRKRYIAILIPFYLIVLIFVVYYKLLGMPMSAGELIAFLSGFILLNTHMWYIVEIALFYLVFFLIFRFCKNRNAGLFLMFLFVFAFTILSLFLGHGDFWFQGEWWYNTSLLFVAGMCLANWEEPIICFAKKHYMVLLTLNILLTAGFWVFTTYLLENFSYWSEFAYPEGSFLGYRDKLFCLSAQLPMVFFFSICVLLVTMKLQFKNPMLNFLGKISLELYLLHNLFLGIFTELIPISNGFLFVVVVMVCSLLGATVIDFLDSWIIGKLQKQK